jgi:hypothetical protein
MCGYGLLFPLNKSFLLFFDAVLGTEFNRELRITMQDTDIAALGKINAMNLLQSRPTGEPRYIVADILDIYPSLNVGLKREMAFKSSSNNNSKTIHY